MSDHDFEVFEFYYAAWQEGEFPLANLKEYIVADIGEDGYKQALAVFRAKADERASKGIKGTLFSNRELT